MPAVSPADSGSPQSAHEKQFTWKIRSRARITRSDDPIPAPQRAHRRIENILRKKMKIVNLQLFRMSLEVAIESGIKKCHLPPSWAIFKHMNWHFQRLRFPQSPIIFRSLPIACLFAHNYDSPKKNRKRMPKNRRTKEAGAKHHSNIKTTVIIKFIWWASPFFLSRHWSWRLRTHLLFNCFRCRFDFDCFVALSSFDKISAENSIRCSVSCDLLLASAHWRCRIVAGLELLSDESK